MNFAEMRAVDRERERRGVFGWLICYRQFFISLLFLM